MYKLIVTSEVGESITLLPQGVNYAVTSIEGLNPPSANINTSSMGLSPGEIFNSSKIGVRNIVINLRLINNIEHIRRELYNVFIIGEKVNLCYSVGSMDYFIDSYVEDIANSPFTSKQKMQISLLCPFPYFQGKEPMQTTISSSGIIVNPGVECGIKMTTSISNPKIANTTNGQVMELTSSGQIEITTQQGNKHIKQNGNEIFPFNKKIDWISLRHGANTITCNGSVFLEFTPLYVGV